jgi:hypothetical protein
MVGLPAVGARWRLFWFEPVSPVNLGLCRVLFFGAIFLFHLGHDYSAWAGVSPVFWEPVFLFRFFHLPVFSREVLSLLQLCWKAALALSCLGCCTRPSTAVSFFLGAYLLGLAHCFSKVSHHDAMLVFIMGILALSRCGDSFSIDRLIRQARAPHPSASEPLPQSGEYTWPVRMVWLVMAMIFFAAAVSKVRYSGRAWITSDHLAIALVRENYHTANSDPLTPWGLYLAHFPWLCQLLGASTLLCEGAFPLALIHPGIRRLVVPSMLGILIGIRVFLGPSFEQFMICFLFWVPWDQVRAWCARRFTGRSKVMLLAPQRRTHRPGRS